MIETILTQEQRNLLRELYHHQVKGGGTEGSFRGRYNEGCQQGQWGVDETERLEELGLVRISKSLALAGVMCVSLTNSGRKYQERCN
jgi:hypothetical protein